MVVDGHRVPCRRTLSKLDVYVECIVPGSCLSCWRNPDSHRHELSEIIRVGQSQWRWKKQGGKKEEKTIWKDERKVECEKSKCKRARVTEKEIQWGQRKHEKGGEERAWNEGREKRWGEDREEWKKKCVRVTEEGIECCLRGRRRVGWRKG